MMWLFAAGFNSRPEGLSIKARMYCIFGLLPQVSHLFWLSHDMTASSLASDSLDEAHGSRSGFVELTCHGHATFASSLFTGTCRVDSGLWSLLRFNALTSKNCGTPSRLKPTGTCHFLTRGLSSAASLHICSSD